MSVGWALGAFTSKVSNSEAATTSGAKRAWNVHAIPTSRFLPKQPLVSLPIKNDVLFTSFANKGPDLRPPVLVTVNSSGTLLEPRGTDPNSALDGVTDRTAGPIPTPVRSIRALAPIL